MKKIAMITNESIFCGKIKNGMAELIDSLANSLASNYEVNIFTHIGTSIFIDFSTPIENNEQYALYKLMNVNYYLIKSTDTGWAYIASSIINKMKPEIFHAFAHFEMINLLEYKPLKTVCTFEQINEISTKIDLVQKYDVINTISNSYQQNILRQRNQLSDTLMNADFRGIPTGILSDFFDPSIGLFLPAKFNKNQQGGKAICKKQLLNIYGIKNNPCLFTMACRLVEEKGIDEIIKIIPHLQEINSYLILVGIGEKKYEQKLKELDRKNNFFWIQKWASPVSLIPLLAGSDFYLSPSIYETCGLMPMNASAYGTIPIVNLSGGLRDNFNEDNAIIIQDGDLKTALNEAVNLYKNKNSLQDFRFQVMSNDFSWETRKQGYIDMYES